ncbi:MAG: hypothetical protein FWG57_09195 [Endomicrobia bacterium]|nr:hypothetical protein [Endomicrobiia bacterium]
MKIKFILTRLPSADASKYPVCITAGVYKNRNRYSKKYQIPSQALIDAVKTLTFHKNFNTLLKDFRKKHKIPLDGYDYEKYLILSKKYEKLGFKNPFLKISYDLLVTFKKNQNNKQLKVSDLLYPHLPTLAIGNFIKINKQSIEINYPEKGYETTEGITIQINSRTTFKDLINYLEKQKKLKKQLTRLPNTQYEIMEEQIKTIRLKKRKTTHKKVAKMLGNKVSPSAIGKRIKTFNELKDDLLVYNPALEK